MSSIYLLKLNKENSRCFVRQFEDIENLVKHLVLPKWEDEDITSIDVDVNPDEMKATLHFRYKNNLHCVKFDIEEIEEYIPNE